MLTEAAVALREHINLEHGSQAAYLRTLPPEDRVSPPEMSRILSGDRKITEKLRERVFELKHGTAFIALAQDLPMLRPLLYSFERGDYLGVIHNGGALVTSPSVRLEGPSVIAQVHAFVGQAYFARKDFHPASEYFENGWVVAAEGGVHNLSLRYEISASSCKSHIIYQDFLKGGVSPDGLKAYLGPILNRLIEIDAKGDLSNEKLRLRNILRNSSRLNDELTFNRFLRAARKLWPAKCLVYWMTVADEDNDFENARQFDAYQHLVN